MNGVKENGEEVYSHHGVLWKSYSGYKDDDNSGTLSIIDYKCSMCIEWKPSDVSVDSDTNDQEWTMVNTGQQRRNSQGTNEIASRSRLFVLRVDELHSFRVTKEGHQLLLQSDSGLQSVFFFQNGNADSFVAALRGILKSAVFKKDRHSYQVIHSADTKVIDQSFAELELFTEHKSDYVWKFVKDFHRRPYETTMTAFSKLTDAWLYGRSSEEKKVEDEVAELLTQSWTPDEPITHIGSEEYEVIGTIPLPQSIPVTRSTPLTVEQWAQFQDAEGRVIDVDELKMIIFKGGIVPALRYEVWKFLLDYFPWDSTNIDRQNIRKQKTDEYFRMKLQWKTMSNGQEERFSDYRERKSLIEKDAKRTDRTIDFFAGENNANLQVLSDILMTYVMYNFDLGYVQGMSDLLSPILCLMTNEADAFWCFVGFMNRVYRNFDLDQSGIKSQLNELQTLLSVVNPELTSYIRHHDSGNMFFCFRWLLVLFKREFSQADVMRLWEVLWTDLPCANFHLLICSAILEAEKKAIMEGNYGFTEILKHVNDLSMKIDLEVTLCNAESIFCKLKSVTQLPDNVRKIIGMEPNVITQPVEMKHEDSKANKTDTSLQEAEELEIVSSLNAISLVASNAEVSYNCSLNLNYL